MNGAFLSTACFEGSFMVQQPQVVGGTLKGMCQPLARRPTGELPAPVGADPPPGATPAGVGLLWGNRHLIFCHMQRLKSRRQEIGKAPRGCTQAQRAVQHAGLPPTMFHQRQTSAEQPGWGGPQELALAA